MRVSEPSVMSPFSNVAIRYRFEVQVQPHSTRAAIGQVRVRVFRHTTSARPAWPVDIP